MEPRKTPGKREKASNGITAAPSKTKCLRAPAQYNQVNTPVNQSINKERTGSPLPPCVVHFFFLTSSEYIIKFGRTLRHRISGSPLLYKKSPPFSPFPGPPERASARVKSRHPDGATRQSRGLRRRKGGGGEKARCL